MRRFALQVQYDGTDFAGFQLQKPGVRTVQGVLEATLLRLTGENIRVHGSGRTDAGVHATGQMVHFDSEWAVPEAKIAVALNQVLPSDVRIFRGWVAPSDFHARFKATQRTYLYTILNREEPSALSTRFVWHLREPLEIEVMQEAALVLTGSHDFATFGAPDAPGKSTVRCIEAITVTREDALLRVKIVGNAFLRQQVRAFVGTLVHAGRGRCDAGYVQEILESRDRSRCPLIAPARGLCLVNVCYSGERINHENLFGEAERNYT
jgi:tRNA pseudouridine38-40 synthase